MFYCPYVPLQMVRAVGQDTFQPKIGFKTRYGLIANPFAETGAISGAATAVNDAVLLTLTDTTKSTSCKLNVILLCEVQTSEKGDLFAFFCSQIMDKYPYDNDKRIIKTTN